MAQFQAIQMQRHQAHTCYREALEVRPQSGRCRCGRMGRSEPPWGSLPGRAPGGTRRHRGRDAGSSRRHNGYAAPIPHWSTPVADVTQLPACCNRVFGYETRVVTDAGKARIIEELNRIAAEARPQDSVPLFYAGHAYLMDDTNMGYWIPVDASVKTAKGWISNTDISRLLPPFRRDS